MSLVRDGLARTLERIALATAKAGRPEGSVRLLAVSKLKPASAVREAWEAGQREFGENYVQELVAKADELRELDLSWALIGNLQSNKAKYVARVGAACHTLDAEGVVRELGKRARAAGRTLPVMIEVNVGGEAQKHGVSPDGAPALVEIVRAEEGLSLRGLMTVPPHTEDPEGARPYFATLRALADRIGRDVLPELSMGMSHDLEAAVLEGATVVRVGTAIFGAR